MAETSDAAHPFDAWVKLVTRLGTPIVTAIGVAFLSKSYLSVSFDIYIASVGVVLTVAGAFIQYLIYSRQMALEIAKLGIKGPKAP